MIMELKQAQINTIIYQKDGGEPEERVIVPTYIPQRVVKALDIQGLPLNESEELVELLGEYQQYYADYISKAYSFEEWVEYTKNKTITPKWRSFKLSNILDTK